MGRLTVYTDIGVYDAPTNLAINDVCLKNVKAGKPIARIYTFSKKGLILAEHESVWDVRTPSLATRRKTGGSVIYADSTTMGYSLFFNSQDLEKDITHIYRRLTGPIAEKLGNRLKRDDIGPNQLEKTYVQLNRDDILPAESNANQIRQVTLGRLFSIRVDGKVLSGHAQHITGDRVQYDGFVHISKPDVDEIGSHIKLRKLCFSKGKQCLLIDSEVFGLDGKLLGAAEDFELSVVRDEEQELRSVYGLQDLGIQKDDYIRMVVESFEQALGLKSESAELEPKTIQEATKLASQFYANSALRDSDSMKRCLGHCFVDLVEPEGS